MNIAEERKIALADPVMYLTKIGHPSLDGLSESLRGGYARWHLFGMTAGSFLQAVIEDKFRQALIKADRANTVGLHDTAIWFYNYADFRAIGPNAQYWGEAGGWFGRRAEQEGEL